jgi:glycosyltransferase involved in cell wall biosynthesis
MQGGIADYTAILAREMVAQGHQVFVLTNPAASENSDASIHLSPTISNWNRAFFGAVNRWSSENQLDIINLQYQTAAYNMAALIHFLPMRVRPFVTTFHDLRFPYLFPKAGFLRPWIVRELARRSDGVIVTNRGDESELRKHPHIARIPLGATVSAGEMSVARRAEVRREMGADESSFVVAHFGFVNHSKGVDTLLRAAKIAGVKVMMIGERVGASDATNQAYAQQIDALADELGIAPHWTGFVTDADLANYFAAADAVALPFRDGASLRRTSLQAALIYGCAIITTHPTDDALPEFTDGQHLLYVPADDAQSLADAITRLQSDSNLRDNLRIGAKSASQQFAWDKIAARVLAFYAVVLSS